MRKPLWLSVGIAVALLGVLTLPALGDSFQLAAPVEGEALTFVDDALSIAFAFSREDGYYRRIAFTLENVSDANLVIDWDASTIILPSGEASNVLREGMAYQDAGTAIAPTTLPPGTRVVDALSPTSRIEHTASDTWALLPMRIQPGSSIGLHLSIVVEEEAREYDFRFTATAIADPQPIAFFESAVASSGAVQVVAARASDPENDEASYSWDFGDGTPTASGRMQTHSYDGEGTYIVTLFVTDSWGRSASYAREIAVRSEAAGAATSSDEPRDLKWRMMAFFSLLGGIVLVFIATEPIRWLWQ